MTEKDRKEKLEKIIPNVDKKELGDVIEKALREVIQKHVRRDIEGRLWLVDEEGKTVGELVGGELSKKKETTNDREVIKEASKMSLQKKEERLVINLPAWLKERLKKRAKQTDQSMNEIIRIALTEYLSK